MKEISVLCTWESRHNVEVPDDFDELRGSSLRKVDEDVLDQCESAFAELVDWKSFE